MPDNLCQLTELGNEYNNPFNDNGPPPGNRGYNTNAKKQPQPKYHVVVEG